MVFKDLLGTQGELVLYHVDLAHRVATSAKASYLLVARLLG
jgi:hypothetical protein